VLAHQVRDLDEALSVANGTALRPDGVSFASPEHISGVRREVRVGRNLTSIVTSGSMVNRPAVRLASDVGVRSPGAAPITCCVVRLVLLQRNTMRRGFDLPPQPTFGPRGKMTLNQRHRTGSPPRRVIVPPYRAARSIRQ